MIQQRHHVGSIVTSTVCAPGPANQPPLHRKRDACNPRPATLIAPQPLSAANEVVRTRCELHRISCHAINAETYRIPSAKRTNLLPLRPQENLFAHQRRGHGLFLKIDQLGRKQLQVASEQPTLRLSDSIRTHRSTRRLGRLLAGLQGN